MNARLPLNEEVQPFVELNFHEIVTKLNSFYVPGKEKE